jgi:hypothetical protein
MATAQIIFAAATLLLSLISLAVSAYVSYHDSPWRWIVVMDVGWAFGSALIWFWWLLDFTGVIPPAPEPLGMAAHLLWVINLINGIGRALLVRSRNGRSNHV